MADTETKDVAETAKRQRINTYLATRERLKAINEIKDATEKRKAAIGWLVEYGKGDLEKCRDAMETAKKNLDDATKLNDWCKQLFATTSDVIAKASG